eukprot:COSAG02_NODE_875_length_16279_cov_199.143078_5_plen_53_part_00
MILDDSGMQYRAFFFFGQFLIDRIEFQFPDVPPTDPIMIYIMISPFVPDQES